MAIYIDVKLNTWSQLMLMDAMDVLKDTLDIVNINIGSENDVQVHVNSMRHAKIEIVNEDKMFNLYMMWDHLEKYMKKRYANAIEKITWDDTERECGYIY